MSCSELCCVKKNLTQNDDWKSFFREAKFLNLDALNSPDTIINETELSDELKNLDVIAESLLQVSLFSCTVLTNPSFFSGDCDFSVGAAETSAIVKSIDAQIYSTKNRSLRENELQFNGRLWMKLRIEVCDNFNL